MKMFRNPLLAGSLLLLGLVSGASAVDVDVFNADIGAGTTTWTAANTYFLNGFVYVEDGETLVIEPGTVIKGRAGTGVNASALFICRGGKIFAEGTPDHPIIFTSEDDDVNDPFDIGISESGKWGGVVLFGKATLNSSQNAAGEAASPIYDTFEGLDADTTGTGGQFVNRFGGNQDDDSSGVMRYVSIRYPGTQFASDKELNGLTIAAVGRGTVLDHIEVFGGSDDGFEWWGGTVNAKYLVSAFCEDDSFDFDQGFRGKNQFFFAIQKGSVADKGMEVDGDVISGSQVEQPPSDWSAYNVTLIGKTNNIALNYRDKTYGKLHNAIFEDFSAVMLVENDGATQVANGDAQVKNTISHNVPTFGTDANADPLFVTANKNIMGDPMLRHIDRDQNFSLDPRPASGSPALDPANALLPPNDGFYDQVQFVGAFPENDLWITRWTALDALQVIMPNGGAAHDLSQLSTPINVTSADITTNTRWTRGNTYILNGFVFVEDGETLTIEPGTVIKGAAGTGVNASCLWVAAGGKLIAEGTPSNPIIFTSADDNVRDPDDIGITESGKWGGVVLCGKAVLNSSQNAAGQAATPIYDVFEGLDGNFQFNGKFVYRFGNNNDHDSSGILKYVSIRYPGTQFASDKELNGLTIAAVGDGTTLEYIEVFGGSDDGYEWWGGAVKSKYLISAFSEDDSFDTDQGYRGQNQFWFAIQKDAVADKGMEVDGDVISGTQVEQPPSDWRVYNATVIGKANKTSIALNFRDKTYGKVFNSIFHTFGALMLVENDGATQVANGQALLQHNLYQNVDVLGTDSNSDPLFETSDKNVAADVMLKSIDKDQKGLLDPRPAFGSPAFDSANVFTPPSDGFFTPVNYVGAFGARNWAGGWTALSSLGILDGRGSAAPEPTPASQTATVGNTVVIQAGGGTGVSTYKWYFNNGSGEVLLEGETGSTLTLNNFMASQAGSYRVEVSNAFGTASSVAVSISTVDIKTYGGVIIGGAVGETYEIQFKTDINSMTWTTLDTVTLTASPFIYVDTTVAVQDAGKRFYRAVPVGGGTQ